MKPLHSSLGVALLRPLSLRSATAQGRPRYLSAASGLVATGGALHVIADDELHLGRFALQDRRPGTLHRLIPGELPDSPRRRKRRKPDFEVLLKLPAMAGLPHGALLALGSGSRARRCLGVLIPLDGRQRPTRPLPIDATPLFSRLSREVGELNIEGGWISAGRLHLLQRGNRGNAPNALIGLALAPVLRSLLHAQVLPGVEPQLLREMPLGSVDGVTVGFTDGTPLPDGRWLFSAVAEDTNDAYRDGRLAGAFIGMAGPRHGLQWMRRIAPEYKIEGIEIDPAARSSLLLVSDADDPGEPAWLLRAKLQGWPSG